MESVFLLYTKAKLVAICIVFPILRIRPFNELNINPIETIRCLCTSKLLLFFSFEPTYSFVFPTLDLYTLWLDIIVTFAVKVIGLRVRFAGCRKKHVCLQLTSLPRRYTFVSYIVVNCLRLLSRDISQPSAGIRLLRLKGVF